MRHSPSAVLAMSPGPVCIQGDLCLLHQAVCLSTALLEISKRTLHVASHLSACSDSCSCVRMHQTHGCYVCYCVLLHDCISSIFKLLLTNMASTQVLRSLDEWQTGTRGTAQTCSFVTALSTAYVMQQVCATLSLNCQHLS